MGFGTDLLNKAKQAMQSAAKRADSAAKKVTQAGQKAGKAFASGVKKAANAIKSAANAAGKAIGRIVAAVKKAGQAFSKAVIGLAQKCVDAIPKTEKYSEGIYIKGDKEFRDKTKKALDDIKKTATGKKLLESLGKTGKTVTIKPVKDVKTDGNQTKDFTSSGWVQSDGKPGKGSDSTVFFNTERKTIGSETWDTRPPAIGLAHELTHADHVAKGTAEATLVDNDSLPDPSDPKKMVQEMKEEVRTVGNPPYDTEEFTENKIRAEWDPKQPNRDWY